MRIEDSDFRSLDNVANYDATYLHTFEVKNKQKSGDKCNFDYKGKLILARNHFGYLNKKVNTS